MMNIYHYSTISVKKCLAFIDIFLKKQYSVPMKNY